MEAADWRAYIACVCIKVHVCGVFGVCVVARSLSVVSCACSNADCCKWLCASLCMSWAACGSDFPGMARVSKLVTVWYVVVVVGGGRLHELCGISTPRVKAWSSFGQSSEVAVRFKTFKALWGESELFMQDEIKNSGHSRMRSEVKGHALRLQSIG